MTRSSIKVILLPGIAVISALGASLASAHSPSPSPGALPSQGREMVCGPQCVKRVLEYYGQRVELTDLIYEMQWPDLQKGASFAGLADALQKRAVNVRPVSLAGNTPICWPHPVIIHFPNPNGGHFAVLGPADPSGQRILWSIGRALHYPADTCFETRTEIILLTSPCAIQDTDLEVLSPPSTGITILAILMPIFPVLLLLLTMRRPLLLRRHTP